MPQIVLVAGLSGAGRSTAAQAFDDQGWFVIDNLPPPLIPKITELAAGPGSAYECIALIVGTGPDRHEVLPALAATEVDFQVLFLEAATDVLIRRYKETRRRHPLSDGSLTEAIELERDQLAEVRARADLVIDTSPLNIHELRQRVRDMADRSQPGSGLSVRVVSFGFKHGVPADADMVFDARFLPNPHWEPELRPLTGQDAPVRDYVLASEGGADLLARIGDVLDVVLPPTAADGRAFYTVAIGCTGGRHRAVALTEALATRLNGNATPAVAEHRDLTRRPPS